MKRIRYKKTRMISLRLTTSQFERMTALMEIAGYKSRTRFIVETVLKTGPRMVRMTDDDSLSHTLQTMKKVYLEMHHEGVNLNQIAAVVNKTIGRYSPESLEQHVRTAMNIAEKLLWRSRDIHSLSVQIASALIPDE